MQNKHPINCLLLVYASAYEIYRTETFVCVFEILNVNRPIFVHSSVRTCIGTNSWSSYCIAVLYTCIPIHVYSTAVYTLNYRKCTKVVRPYYPFAMTRTQMEIYGDIHMAGDIKY